MYKLYTSLNCSIFSAFCLLSHCMYTSCGQLYAQSKHVYLARGKHGYLTNIFWQFTGTVVCTCQCLVALSLLTGKPGPHFLYPCLSWPVKCLAFNLNTQVDWCLALCDWYQFLCCLSDIINGVHGLWSRISSWTKLMIALFCEINN